MDFYSLLLQALTVVKWTKTLNSFTYPLSCEINQKDEKQSSLKTLQDQKIEYAVAFPKQRWRLLDSCHSKCNFLPNITSILGRFNHWKTHELLPEVTKRYLHTMVSYYRRMGKIFISYSAFLALRRHLGFELLVLLTVAGQ